jgi:hypothetical protein
MDHVVPPCNKGVRTYRHSPYLGDAKRVDRMREETMRDECKKSTVNHYRLPGHPG